MTSSAMRKICWVSGDPKTGVGRSSRLVKEVLQDTFEIDLICSDELSEERVKNCQIVFYNFGNSKDMLNVYKMLRKYPGVVILHDRTYHHFFAHYYLEFLRREDLYLEVLNLLYGSEEISNEIKSNIRIWESEKCLKYHLRELLYPYALAIIVHAKDYADTIKQEFNGKVFYVPLPLDYNKIQKLEEFKKNISNNRDDRDRLYLLSYGFINSNRMIDVVLKVIGETNELKKKVYYTIAGPIEETYRRKLEEIINNYHLNNIVRITGFLEDEILYTYINSADVCINLREFNTEGMSYSLLEQMSLGKAVIVNKGTYLSEFPNDVIIKIRSEDDLRKILLELVQDKKGAEIVGMSAKNYTLKNFSREAFVNSFLEILKELNAEITKRKILYNLKRELIKAVPSIDHPCIRRKFFMELARELLRLDSDD